MINKALRFCLKQIWLHVSLIAIFKKKKKERKSKNYGVHLRTKIIESKRQFEVQKLDYPCRNLVTWIWNRNERSRNGIIRTWSYFQQVETVKGKLDIADVEVQITIPTKMQITSFELQFTFSTLKSHLIVNNATIIFHLIPNETFNLNLKSPHIFEFEKPKFQFERIRSAHWKALFQL